MPLSSAVIRGPRVVSAWWIKDLTAALTQPKVMERLRGMGIEPDPLTGEPFQKFVRNQYEVWGMRVREAGIQPE